MTLNEWIDEYCEENEIELPDDIADGDTALNYLILNAGGGGGNNGNLVKINCEYVEDVGTVLDKTFAELYEICKTGKIVYICVGGTLDDDYGYVSSIYMLSKIYKYDTAYRVCFTGCAYSNDGTIIGGLPAILNFEVENPTEYPVLGNYLVVEPNSTADMGNLPW